MADDPGPLSTSCQDSIQVPTPPPPKAWSQLRLYPSPKLLSLKSSIHMIHFPGPGRGGEGREGGGWLFNTEQVSGESKLCCFLLIMKYS